VLGIYAGLGALAGLLTASSLHGYLRIKRRLSLQDG